METKQEPIYRPYLIFLWAVCIGVLLSTFLNCTPQKRLDRLVERHPELKKTDTIFVTKTITVPGTKKDSSISISYNLNGLDTIFSNYNFLIDSLKKQVLKKEIKTYIINRKCLEDTFKIPLKNNGFVKFYQTNKKFVYQMYEPDKLITIKEPVIVTKIETVTRRSWPMFFGGFFTAILLAFILILIYKPKQ